MFSSKEKIVFRTSVILALFLVSAFWLYTLFSVPTFDLDESLYRRAAEEMKRSGNYWLPAWDQVPLYHKPPIFYWFIILASACADASKELISSVASRIPSLFCSAGIIIGLYFSNRLVLQEKDSFFESAQHNWTAPLLYLSALFPILTGTSVIFDPFQTLCLFPALILMSRYFVSQSLTVKEICVAAFSIFAATAVKGLNGILIPAFAFGLHGLLILFTDRKISARFLSALKMGLKIFLPAAALSFVYYFYLDQRMGRAFTEEFFLVHHFGRSQQAMENHGGSFLYHPVFLWIGGGFLSFYIFNQFLSKKWEFLKFGFPLTFTAAFLILFSFSSTKLPHYTWPVWIAIAMQGGILSCLFSKSSQRPSPQTFFAPWVSWITGFFGRLPLIFWAAVFAFLAVSPIELIRSFLHSHQADVILKFYSGMSFIQQSLLFASAFICISIAFLPKQKISISLLALSNLFCCLSLGFLLRRLRDLFYFHRKKTLQ